MTKEELLKKIDFEKSWLYDCGIFGSDVDIAFHAIKNSVIEVLEQEPKWIPVSERLPEVGSEVLVCYDFKGNRSVYIANFYGDGEFHGYDDEYLTSEGRKYRKAVAWMPSPEPYEAESEEEE